ncbi:MAG: TRAP transporter small permease subunit [Pseudomonadota bacterium]
MSGDDATEVISREGRPAILVRGFGWLSLSILVAFLISNVLVVAYRFPGADQAFTGGGTQAYIQLALYILAIVVAVGGVLKTPNRSLRWDARIICDFNIYLVRACFWTVLFVGLIDFAIAFMRVEKLLTVFLSDDTARSMGLGRFVGPYVHVPLMVAGFVVAMFTRTLGFTWLALLIVIAELAIVISRFVFSYEQAFMGDLVRYWYAALFLFASAYTLLDEGHVRVDVLYAGFSNKTKGFANAIGSILFGMTTAWVIIIIGFNGRTAVINSPVASFEVSQSGGTGMFIKYQMAAFLGVFAITMLIQFVSYLFEAVADWRDEPGRREPAAVAH